MRYIEEYKYALLIYDAALASDLKAFQQYVDEFNHLNPDIQHAAEGRFFDSAFNSALSREDFVTAEYIAQHGLPAFFLDYALYSLVHARVDGVDWGPQGISFEDLSSQLTFLIQQGSNINYLDEQGRTPLDIAELYETPDIELLRQAGAKHGKEM
jgi:ankyrin repeat protein